MCGLDSSSLEYSPMAGLSEYGNISLYFIKVEIFLTS
jgi:hypothetical protein